MIHGDLFGVDMNSKMTIKIVSPMSISPEKFESKDAYALAESSSILPMIKTALLYGDDVSVISPSYSAAATFPLNMYGQLYELARQNHTENFPVELEEDFKRNVDLARQRNPVVLDILLKAAIRQDQETGIGMSKSLLHSREAEEIRRAHASGLVSGVLDSMMEDAKLPSKPANVRHQCIHDSWLAGAPLASDYILSDEETLGALFPDSMPSELSISTFVALDMFQRLPNFSTVPMDELLGIRDELNPYLVPFRSAVLTLSREVARHPMSRALHTEVELEMRRTIEPSVKAIEDAVRSKTYLARLAENAFGKDLAIIGGGGLCAGFASLAGLAGAAGQAYAAAAGAVLGGLTLTAKAAFEWKREMREIEGSGFFFYYKLHKRLSNKKR